MNHFEYVNKIPLSMNVTFVKAKNFKMPPLRQEAKLLFGITLEANATHMFFTLHWFKKFKQKYSVKNKIK